MILRIPFCNFGCSYHDPGPRRQSLPRVPWEVFVTYNVGAGKAMTCDGASGFEKYLLHIWEQKRQHINKKSRNERLKMCTESILKTQPDIKVEHWRCFFKLLGLVTGVPCVQRHQDEHSERTLTMTSFTSSSRRPNYRNISYELTTRDIVLKYGLLYFPSFL